MVSIQSKPEPELLREGIKVPVKETLLTPRFYTTDYDKVAKMDVSSQQAELEAVVEELRVDYNRNHYKRNDDFKQSWEHIDGETRAAFIDFLERSCTSEFSGFLLFKELSRQLSDRSPLLAEAFNLMARDEARHAGFLNKAMKDFNLSLDLVNMTKKRSYTFISRRSFSTFEYYGLKFTKGDRCLIFCGEARDVEVWIERSLFDFLVEAIVILGVEGAIAV